MDLRLIVNAVDRDPLETCRPIMPQPSTPKNRKQSPRTTRSDRIRIKAHLKWATPRTINARYPEYTVDQIKYARDHPVTPTKHGRNPKIPHAVAIQLKEWLLSDPANRRVPYRDIPRFAPQFAMYGEVAISTALTSQGYGRRVAKRKGFSDDPGVADLRVQFAEIAKHWSLDRLMQQVFSDEVWAFGGAFTQSYVTVLVDGDKADIEHDRYLEECVQHKYSKRPSWMFHSTIYHGRKGPALFWEKDWGKMNSDKYDERVLSTIEEWFNFERSQGREPI